TLLPIAVDTGNTTIASLLLQAGADPTEWTDHGALYECQPLHWAATKKNLEMMKVLLNHNAPLDTQAASAGCSETVLQMACSTGHLEMVKLLLGYGANTECVGHYGTALGFALHSQSVNLDVVKMLLANGADASVE
ncbi:ankyrin repeat-containing domain protein, partial [Mycena vitilis]